LTTTTEAPVSTNCNKFSFILTLIILVSSFLIINFIIIILVLRYAPTNFKEKPKKTSYWISR
jgi:hypothetical protein